MEQLLAGITVTSGFPHEGEARRLVHALKYGAHPAAARVLAGCLAPLVPPGARVLIPVPRVPLRKLRFGVDPARELAVALGHVAGCGVLVALRAPLWCPPRAARNRAGRALPVFQATSPAPPGSILVDDVATTGATLAAAAAALGGSVHRALTATAVWA